MLKRVVQKMQNFAERLEGSPAEAEKTRREGGFRANVRSFVEDGILTVQEVEYLANLRDQLGLDAGWADKCLEDEVVKFFRNRLSSANYSSFADALELIRRLKADIKNLDASWTEVKWHLHREIDQYLTRMFDVQWADHLLTEGEVTQFKEMCKKLGEPFDKVAKKLAPKTITHLESFLQEKFAAEELSEESLLYVSGIASEFCLGDNAKYRLDQLGSRLLTLTRIRSGQLPSYETRLALDSGERCIFSSYGQFVQLSNQRTPEDGEFVLTDRRTIFARTRGGTYEIPLRKIYAVNNDGQALRIEGSKKNGSGYYFVVDRDLASEILYTAIKIEKRLRLPEVDGERTRSIPQAVRHEVWIRDGGRCVQCTATEYLEYDHVIPFAKGGSSSANNVQILCRACNLAKSDRI